MSKHTRNRTVTDAEIAVQLKAVNTVVKNTSTCVVVDHEHGIFITKGNIDNLLEGIVTSAATNPLFEELVLAASELIKQDGYEEYRAHVQIQIHSMKKLEDIEKEAQELENRKGAQA